MSESLDRNKTSLTHVATATAAAWLDCLGCKPVETEVPLEDGWVADLASFWSPTMTEAKRSKLMRAIVPDALTMHDAETFALMARRVGGRLTVCVEVKVTRGDFLADLGRKYGTNEKPASLLPPAHLCVLAAPQGVIRDEWLNGWGVLRLSADASRVIKLEHWHRPNALHPYQVENLIAGVALRRDHQTRYASVRRFWRSYRLTLAEELRSRKAMNARMTAMAGTGDDGAGGAA